MEEIKRKSRKILEKLQELQGKRILIFGDVGIDEYVSGNVLRISPEAPVPVVEVKTREKKPGLSANVAANVNSLGGKAFLFSVIGRDLQGDELKKLLEEKNISTRYLFEDSERKTTTKLRIMSSHQHIVRVDFESRKNLSEKGMAEIQNQLSSVLDQCDCVVIQDYAKGLVNGQSCRKLIQLANEKNKPVLVDPHRRTKLEFYRGAQFMTPNRDEALELARQIPKPEIWNDLSAVGYGLMDFLNSPKMVITLGDRGIQLFEENGTLRLPTFSRQVFDVTGAGDTVISAFALAVSAGWTLEEGGILANMAGGIVVGQVGAGTCKPEDMLSCYTDRV